MPKYDYKCPKCGEIFEVDHRMDDITKPSDTLVELVGCESDQCGFQAEGKKRSDFKDFSNTEIGFAMHTVLSKEGKSEMLKKRSKQHAATKGKEYRQAVKMGEAGRKNLL